MPLGLHSTLFTLCSTTQGAYTKNIACYRPQRSWGKVIFSQACVILFTVPGPGGAWSRGVCAWSGGGGCVPGPGGPGGDPPRRLLLRAVRILLECILVILKLLHSLKKDHTESSHQCLAEKTADHYCLCAWLIPRTSKMQMAKDWCTAFCLAKYINLEPNFASNFLALQM